MITTADSILSKLEYSARLQQAYLPKKRHFDRIFSDSFVLYRPAEYLSGDFYWVAAKDSWLYAAVGDCTGHGVSAAFLSMLGFNYLNHALHNKGLRSTSEMLMEVDKQVIEAFSSVNEDRYDNDWIDISLIAFHPETRQLHFSGANRKVLILAGDYELLLRGSKYPVGGWQMEEERSFQEQSLVLPPDAAVYMGSDGFQDQYNESVLRKIGSRRLHELLKCLQSTTMTQQKQSLEQFFHSWKGTAEQTDDICLVGLRL